MFNMSGYIPFWGIELRDASYMEDLKQFRFPKSKKARIRKKFRKNPLNWRYFPSPTVYRMGNVIIGHPVTLKKIRQEVENRL